MNIKDITRVTGGELLKGIDDFPAKGFSIDSRIIKPGQIFIAIKGDNFDGHDFVEDAIEKWGDGYQILAGKKVFEIKPSQANKGKVIEALMADMPFTDRCPVYIGDDITDEDGFAAVNRLGGHSIRVGASPTTCARYAVPDVSRLLDWLADVATRMRPPIQ